MTLDSKYSFKELIGKEARRMCVSVRCSDGSYHHVFSIIEQLEPDMQDALADENDVIIHRSKNSCKDSASIYLSFDRIKLSHDFIYAPWNKFMIGKDPILWDDRSDIKWKNGNPDIYTVISANAHSNEKSEIQSLLPYRYSSAFCNYCKPIICPTVSDILNSDVLKGQLTEMSKEYLGYDLCMHENMLGSCIFVRYNPYYRDLKMRMSSDRKGVFFRMNYRRGITEPLTIDVVGYNDASLYLFKHKIKCVPEQFVYYADFGNEFSHLSVKVKDSDNIDVDIYPKVTFIKTIEVRTAIKELDVVAQTKKGEEKTFEKYSKEKPLIIGDKPIDNSFWDVSPEFSYAKLEDALDFVFFPGGKGVSEMKENLAKASKCIMRILNSAENRITICDPYFDLKAFSAYILPVKSLDVEIRILTSAGGLNSEKRSELKDAVEEYNKKVNGAVECRMLRGDTPDLHDRFIIADKKAWMLGCSLNKFGIRATTLIRVPKDYVVKLIQRSHEWWNDDEESVEL